MPPRPPDAPQPATPPAAPGGTRDPLGRPLLLASGSPRRRELLAAAGLHFSVMPADLEEHSLPGETPADLCVRLAREKAAAVAASRPEPAWVLGADTVVALGDRVLGKPRDEEDAVATLAQLAGGWHQVFTGVAVVAAPEGRSFALCVESRVHMRDAGEAELRDYAATGEPMDKAGAYAIQGEAGRRFVTQLEGSESNVIGLPVEETLALLARARAACGPAEPAP